MSLIKSKKRVADHGEVFTPDWLVEKMLDLVKGETERIDSRFLEPACGSGNFLVPILQRKLAAVELKCGKSDFDKRHYALLGLMCCYGIELLADNIDECRANMLEVFAAYLDIDETDDLYRAASFVLSLNLVHGEARQMRWRDIQFDQANPSGDKPICVVGVRKNTKTSQNRDVQTQPNANKTLKEWRTKTPYAGDNDLVWFGHHKAGSEQKPFTSLNKSFQDFLRRVPADGMKEGLLYSKEGEKRSLYRMPKTKTEPADEMRMKESDFDAIMGKALGVPAPLGEAANDKPKRLAAYPKKPKAEG